MAAHSEDATCTLRPEDAHPRAFWRDFVARAERELAAAGVRNRGCADGDLSLGTYASLRNEAFVPARAAWALPSSWMGIDQGCAQVEGQYVYPPNVAGYNAAGSLTSGTCGMPPPPSGAIHTRLGREC